MENQITFKVVKKMERNAGIDLMRIVGMYAIIIDHILIHGKLLIRYKHYKQLHLLLTFCFWHVDSFALISGIVGYKTNNNYCNIMYLWFYVLFYSLSIFIIFIILAPQLTNNYKIILLFFPVTNKTYWYFTEYFHMYLFIPIINKGINHLNQNQLKMALVSLFFINIILKDIINPKVEFLNSGYSLLWLLILYITGAYFGKFLMNFRKRTLFFYLINLIIFIGSSLLCYYNQILIKNKVFLFNNLFKLRFNSIAMIIQVFSLLLIILNINFNQILRKIICFFGPLTFGVYLIHDNRLVRGYFISKIFKNSSRNLQITSLILLILIKSFIILCFCLLIDLIRNCIFIILRIKKICIYFDKILNNLSN